VYDTYFGKEVPASLAFLKDLLVNPHLGYSYIPSKQLILVESGRWLWNIAFPFDTRKSLQEKSSLFSGAVQPPDTLVLLHIHQNPASANVTVKYGKYLGTAGSNQMTCLCGLSYPTHNLSPGTPTVNPLGPLRAACTGSSKVDAGNPKLVIPQNSTNKSPPGQIWDTQLNRIS
jgi:hypothetical protein